jgi:hypothetical protein
MNIKQSLVLFSSLFFSFSAMSASKWLGDWFEVEVILISQLDNKAKLKEVFLEQDFAIDYNNSLDLLSPYVNPDIATLKQQLPVCNKVNDERSYLEQAVKWPTFHLSKTISTLNAEQLNEHALAQQQNAVKSIDEKNQLATSYTENTQLSESLNESQISEQHGDNDDFFDRVKTKQELSKESLVTASGESGLKFNPNNNSDSLASNVHSVQTLNNEPSALNENLLSEVALTEEQKAFVLEAEKAFSDVQFIYSSTFPAHYQSLDTDLEYSSLCYMSQSEFEQLNVNESLYSYNGFLVNKMPSTINNPESIYSEAPYLISEDSLHLKDIVKQLRRSKDFRPLLHLAWRQPVFEKNDSQPIKIFAGDNVQGQFAKNLVTYQTEKNALLFEEKTLNNIFTLSENIRQDADMDKSETESLSAQTVLEQIKAQKINDILQQLPHINNVEEVVKSIERLPQRLDKIDENSMISTEPMPPVQPWYVEGLIDVYLIGNYLHVSNDFSILNMTLAEQESLKLKSNILENTVQTADTRKVIPIRMTQDRRMISREVHYFDHPFMGIIVQIRRHQRPEFPVEEIDNSSNTIQ